MKTPWIKSISLLKWVIIATLLPSINPIKVGMKGIPKALN